MKKLSLVALVVMVMVACGKNDPEPTKIYVDGSYKAMEATFNYGWKGFLKLEIFDDKVTSVQFDYNDSTMMLKSETSATAYPMDPHPSVWLPEYETSLKEAIINPFEELDAITGATHSGDLLNTMTKVLLKAAKTGDTADQIISAE